MPDFEQPRFTWASERHLRLEFAPHSSTTCIAEFVYGIRYEGIPGLIDITPAARTLLLEFSLEDFDEDAAVSSVRRASMPTASAPRSAASSVIDIPVCYDAAYAPDAADVADMHGITPAELIRLHSEAQYVVEFIGFAPGFGYLGGLPAQLHTPRLATPRARVPAGSVGIAADQSCVYPGNTAGGWRLIGRTPLRMFDVQRPRPSLLSQGDRVRFTSISQAEFESRMRDGSQP